MSRCTTKLEAFPGACREPPPSSLSAISVSPSITMAMTTAWTPPVAQVFNERGDGVIVRGGPARISRHDRQPHLTAADACGLLQQTLDAYRLEHRTLPARVVLHKASSYDEIDGFQQAANDRNVDSLELDWVTSGEAAQLFRPGAAPPLRGTMISLSSDEIALYTKGTVEFYSTYPGMYVPRPIGIRPALTDRGHREMPQRSWL